jgi:hypothetical protein
MIELLPIIEFSRIAFVTFALDPIIEFFMIEFSTTAPLSIEVSGPITEFFTSASFAIKTGELHLLTDIHSWS